MEQREQARSKVAGGDEDRRAPASGRSGRAEADPAPKEKEGIPWREILPDKAIDLLLIPTGFFVALWFQGYVDDRKARADYVEQLESFREEIATNREKAATMEQQLGPIDARQPGEALGPLGRSFPTLDACSSTTRGSSSAWT